MTKLRFKWFVNQKLYKHEICEEHHNYYKIDFDKDSNKLYHYVLMKKTKQKLGFFHGLINYLMNYPSIWRPRNWEAALIKLFCKSVTSVFFSLLRNATAPIISPDVMIGIAAIAVLSTPSAG